MNKEDLCRKFVTDPEDDIFQIVETLVDLRDQDSPCVFPSRAKKQCTRPIVTPFGICQAHLKTKKGTDLAILWNDTLEELGIEESEEVEEEDVEEVEEDDEPKKEVETKKVEPKKEVETKKQEPKKDVETKKVEPKKQEPKKEVETKKVEPKKQEPKKDFKKPISEDEDSPDDSGVAQFIPQKSEEVEDTETEPEKEEEKPERIRFVRSEFDNFVHPETRLVVRPRDKVILGMENDSGGINDLTKDQIEWCKKYGLNYVLQD